VIRKNQLINALFLVGFPVFGIGSYIGLKQGISKGMIVTIMPFMAIILFYVIDVLYRKRIGNLLTRMWWLSMLYIGTLVVSMFVGLRNGIPGLNTGNVLLSCLVFMAPFNAAVIVLFYNRDDPDFSFADLLLKGLVALLGINVLGYLAGVQAYGHSFEGRANFPFMRGIYTGAHVLSVAALMGLYHLRTVQRKPVAMAVLLGALGIALFFMMKINSRLSFMIFLLLAVLFLTKAVKVVRGLYTISLLTMPLLLSFSLLVYQVLSTPFFVSILQRVSKEDVTTFNGRSYMWNAVWDWAMYDRTGLIFGNGYKGHYKLHLLDFVAVLWGEPHSYNLHSHSTFTEVLTGQGIFGVVLLYIILWYGFKHFRRSYLEGGKDASIFAGLVYILFIWQIDIFCYGVDIGHAIMFCMMAPLCLRPRAPDAIASST
jgi:O-antigen ligase